MERGPCNNTLAQCTLKSVNMFAQAIQNPYKIRHDLPAEASDVVKGNTSAHSRSGSSQNNNRVYMRRFANE